MNSPAGGELLAELRARDEPADPRLGDELVVLDEHVPAEQHRLGRADDLGALVEVVVDPRVLVAAPRSSPSSPGSKTTMSASEPTASVPFRG